MNWEAAGAIGEIVGALGVMASLLYLATQIKASSISSKVEAKLTTTGFMTGFNSNFINDPELYDIWTRAHKGVEDFTPQELARFTNLNFNAVWFFSAAHYQKRMGTLGSGEWFELQAMMEYYLSNKGVRDWWERFAASRVDPHYVQYVEAEIYKKAAANA